MNPPAIVIRCELESTMPRVFVDTVDEGEAWRLYDWLESQPALRSLVELAHELSERAA